jgi:PAS domain S-box-containing protein
MEAGGRAGWEPAFRAVFEASRNAIAILDKDRRVIDANAAVADVLGYSHEEFVGMLLRELVPPAELEETDRALELLRREGTGSGNRSLLHADSRLVNVQYAGRVTELPGHGEVAIYVVIDSRVLQEGETALTDEAGSALTPRENEVVRLVALGRTGDEIADELHVSPETVRSHVRNAMGKTESRNRAQLVATALARRLITI